MKNTFVINRKLFDANSIEVLYGEQSRLAHNNTNPRSIVNNGHRTIKQFPTTVNIMKYVLFISNYLSERDGQFLFISVFNKFTMKL